MILTDEVRVTLSPQEGFGMPDPNLMITDDIDNAPPEFRVVGARPTFQNEQGDTMVIVVTRIEDEKITADGNHPFAGKTATFLLGVIGVRDDSEADDAQGIITSQGPSTLQ